MSVSLHFSTTTATSCPKPITVRNKKSVRQADWAPDLTVDISVLSISTLTDSQWCKANIQPHFGASMDTALFSGCLSPILFALVKDTAKNEFTLNLGFSWVIWKFAASQNFLILLLLNWEEIYLHLLKKNSSFSRIILSVKLIFENPAKTLLKFQQIMTNYRMWQLRCGVWVRNHLQASR